MAISSNNTNIDRVSLPPNTLVVDPGAYTIKAGLVTCQEIEEDEENNSFPQCHIIPNCIARSRTKQTYVGSDLSKCTDFGEMQFRRPVEKGYIVNWDLERAIFEHEFLDEKATLYCEPSTTSLLITEPPNSPATIQSNTDQIIFEEFSFAAAYRCLSSTMHCLNPLPEPICSSFPSTSTSNPIEIFTLVDASHSHTIITPVLRSRALQNSIRRLTPGGKHISNYLAEQLSLRHFSLMDEPYIVEQIKRDACYVSLDFSKDLERCWKGNRRKSQPIPKTNLDAHDQGSYNDTIPLYDQDVEYVLPNYTTLHHGTLRSRQNLNRQDIQQQNEETFPLANERFTAPELIFHPGDIGLKERGLPETIMQCLQETNVPKSLWQGFLGNVVLTGGSTLLPGFADRVYQELRSLVDVGMEVGVRRVDDPITATWQGGARLAQRRDLLNNVMVTKEQYFEHGENWVKRQFAERRIVKDWSEISSQTEQGKKM